MNSSVNKNNVIVVILFIFSIVFVTFTYISYVDKKEDLKFIEKNIQIRINNLYEEISDSMLKTQLKSRSNFILNKYKKNEKLKAFKAKDKDKLHKLFKMHFETLKDQIKGFEIMQFITPDGKSLLRVHDAKRYGDDLSKIRPCITSIIKSPRVCSFFEVGINGLAYRHITPVYFENELLGFMELGVKPSLLMDKIKSVFRLKGYFFIKEDTIPKDFIKTKNNLFSKGYYVCQFCSKKDKFIIDNIKNIDIDNKENNTLKYNNNTYTIIKKDIFDAQSTTIGKIVFFQDVTLFETQIKQLIIKSIIIFIVTSIIIFFILNRYINKIFKKLNKARYLLDNTNDAVYVINLNNETVVDINERASLMLGYSKSELLRKKLSQIREPINNNKENWEEFVRKLKLKHFITRRGIYIKKDGSKFPVESSLSYIHTEDGEFMISVVRDITIQLDMEEKINKKSQELQRLQDVISKAVLYTTSDLDGKITSVSKAFEDLSGYKEAEVIGKNHSLFRNPNTPKEFYIDMWETLQKDEKFVGEIKNYTKERGEYWIKITIDPLFNEKGEKIGYSSYRENITDKKELEYISTHDTLTGIYNRAYFKDELARKIKSAKRYNHQFGFIMLDIDHFKSVNDTYGHQVGDEVLKTMSNSIETHIREDDTFARWGGEEFVIIANGSNEDDLKLLVEKLQKEIAKNSFSPVPSVTSSFGITIFKEGDNEESIQKRADDALYKAKENGRNRYEVL